LKTHRVEILIFSVFGGKLMARSTKNAEPDLALVLDFGGSLTKIIYRDKSGLPKVLCMEPEVLLVPKEAIRHYEATKLGTGTPANSAWVCVDEESCYVVGYLAKSQFNGNPGLHSIKYERAFPKTLAAVWAVASTQGLTKKKKLRVALAVVLPPGEHKNADQLKELITDGLAEFETPTGTINATLTNYDCKPEGGGVYLVHAKNQGKAVMATKTVAVVMVGYRNASILVANRGVVDQRETSALGFIKLVEQVKSRISTMADSARLAKAIALAGWEVRTEPLTPLAVSSVAEVRLEETRNLAEVITAARSQYVSSLTSWLRDTLPKDLDEVVLCGGTAYYLQEALVEHFHSVDIIWDASMELPEDLQTPELGKRMSDAYGIYQYFTSKVLGVTANV
jgi:hypothetical protein